MVDSVGNSNAYMQILMPRHNQQNLFKKVDGDGSGGVSQVELKTLADHITNRTGKTMQVDEASFAKSDKDGNGSLSASELETVMAISGFGPPKGMEGMGTTPSPPSQEQAVSAYSSQSGEDSLSSMIAVLQKLLDTLKAASGDQGASTTTSNSIGIGGGHHGPRDIFKKVDTDGSGGISKDELKVLAENLKKMTGQSIAVDDGTFAKFDSDNDGSLNSEELKSFMDKSGFAPPPPPEGLTMGTSANDSQSGSSSATSSGLDSFALFEKILEQLTKYRDAKDTGNSSLLSVYS